MRADALGLWWRDEPPPKKEKVVKEKREPPNPFWLAHGYLPPPEDIVSPHIISDGELADAYRRKDKLIYDVESYWNYFIVSFMSYTTGQVVYFEIRDDERLAEIPKLLWILRNFTLVGFNSIRYDIAIVTLAAAGAPCKVLKEATNKIILENWRVSDVLKSNKVKRIKDVDHIDLIEVAPLDGSLKTYGGRLFTPRMQDLPFHAEAKLTTEQIAIVRNYNVNDLIHTAFLLSALKEQIELREIMSMEYRTDLRSKSDAQVAEAVIATQWRQMNSEYPRPPEIEPGTVFYYKVPDFLKFESPLMKWVLDVVRTTQFVVEWHGSIGMPKSISELHLKIGNNVYRMGLGGLHSSETTSAHVAGKEWIISDRDVTSFYPQIILNLGLYPEHLGIAFLKIYDRIVQRRLQAKKNKQVAVADSLKIVVNGTFGKLGSKYSIFYSPNLLIQVTLTGQLVLLMLIERLELAGFEVISANTDGVVVKCPVSREAELAAVIAQWEKDTAFSTEETKYEAYYTRDVNNYIAVKEGKKGVKAKGAYLNPWNNDPKLAIFRLHKNPVNIIILEAVETLLTKGTPVEETIKACKDTYKFTALRKVTGGAVCGDRFLGRVIRWYHATGEQQEIIYAKNGNRVPASAGAKPMMQMSAALPQDIDYDWYIAEAHNALKDIGFEAS